MLTLHVTAVCCCAQAVPEIVQQTMDEVAAITGRPHKLFEYTGHPEAERVIIAMGSGCPVIQEAVDYLTARGEKVGLLKVHLFRPWSASHFLAGLPKTANKIAVLDRTKEQGSLGEPLYLDVVTTLAKDAVGEWGWLSAPAAADPTCGGCSRELSSCVQQGQC